ncbi:serine protease [Streptomyces sp. NPDC050803]|uniref:serine protease n=1 Tax=unclassified Streptomyces TaxID=2593676 RepID=UPI00341DFC14
MTAAPDDELPGAIARFWSADGQVAGCGFLVAERTLCTCAHVVASALGTPDTDETPPVAAVTVDFPLLSPPSDRLRATVTHWRPVAPDGGGDMALLTLEESVPGTAPVRFAGGAAVWDHAFRVVGFPQRTDDHGVWVDGRLRAAVGKGWASMEARPVPGGPPVGRGFSGGPVWDSDQGGVVGMTVAAEVGTGATTAYLIPAALLLGLDPALRPSPFRGLEPFREQDAGVFFARAADTERIVRAVRTQPFVPVAGASGVGKSSLVRAGALPLLRAAGYTVTDFVGQPGAAPVRVLLAALRDRFPDLTRTTGERLTEETAVLIGARLLERSGPAGHVIVLDQFEETVGAEPARARELLGTLLTMASARHPDGRHLRVLTTLRSASLEDLVAGGDAERLSVTVQMLAPMTRQQLAEIVRRPLESVPGVDFEPGLAERIVTDAGTGAGALPLVEFVLSRLWERRDRGRLTHAAYRELGGVDGALAAYADQQLKEVCAAPDGPSPEVARRLFEQLVLPDGGQGFARVARAYDALPPEQRTAAQSLASTRLLVIARDSRGRETVALAHESLVRQWPTLREWLEETRGFRVWQERVRARMRDWEEGERHPDLLLRGQEFATARQRAAAHAEELTAAEVEFIELSRRQQRRVVRRGRAVAAVVAVLALVAGLLTYFVREADSQAELKATEEVADRLAAAAEEKRHEDPVAAAVMALRAYRTASTDGTRKALMSMYAPMSSVSLVDGDFLEGRVVNAAASADGSRVALLHRDDDNVLRAYLVTGLFGAARTKHEIQGIPEHANQVAVSDDGSRVSVSGPEGHIKVWSTKALDEPLRHWRWEPEEDVSSTSDILDFSADGRHLLHVVGGAGMCFAKARLKSYVHLYDIEGKRQQSVPSDGWQSEGCLHGAALPAGKGASGSLITVIRNTAGDELLNRYAVRISQLGTGDLVWKRDGLNDATIGPGGRYLGTIEADRTDGSYREPATGTRLDGGGDFQAPNSEEETGRFLVQEHGSLGVWCDRVSGRRYVAPIPDALSAGASETPYLFATAGADGPRLLALTQGRLIEVRASAALPLSRGGDGGASVSFSSSGRESAALVSESDNDSSAQRHTLSFLGGPGPASRTLTSKDLPKDSWPSLTVSGNGRRAVVWGDWGWTLYHLTSEKLTRVEHARDLSDTSTSVVRDVQPVGSGDFLLLGRNGVQRLDGSKGRLTRSKGADCDEKDDENPRYCVALAVSPGKGHEALALQNNGTARTWSLVDGSEGPYEDFGDGSDSSAGSVLYRDDGGRVAVAVREGVFVWDPGSGHVRQLDPGYLARVALFEKGGRLVLTDAESSPTEADLWSEHHDRLIATLSAPRPEGAWHLSDDTLRNGTEWGTWEIPLEQSALAEGLCRAIGTYDPPALRENLPPAAHTKALCPGEPGQSAMS